MKAPILLTGFEPFAGHPANPSGLVARALAGRSFSGYRVRAAVLPVVYARIEAEIDRLLTEVKPAAVVSLGLDYKTDAIKLERIAINLDDAAIPDEAGDLRTGTRIAPRGPAARWSTLPLDAIAAALAASGAPFKFSSHAGAFLCNHLMYHLSGRAARTGIPAGFVHLPPTPDLIRAEDQSSRPGVPLDSQIEGMRAVVRALAESLAWARAQPHAPLRPRIATWPATARQEMTVDSEIVRRSVTVGGLRPTELLTELERSGVRLNEYARILLTSPLFDWSRKRESLATVELSVRNLGLRDGGCWSEMQGRAAAMDLLPPPVELAPHLRLQYLDQPEGHCGFPATSHRAPPGSITVASLPLSGDPDFPRGFYLRRIDGDLWLRGYTASNDHVWDPLDRLVFIAAKDP